MKCIVILAVSVLATVQLVATPANALTPTQSAASGAKAKAQSEARTKAQAAVKARTDALARANTATAAKAKALEAAKLGIRNETKSRVEAAEKAAKAQIGLKSARTEPVGQTLGNPRNQGKHIAVMTYIGDGGQSTGVTYEGLNFAAVQNLGVVLFVENNLWAYSTPAEMQFRVKDLAERAIGYGIPGVIIDGTDACQVYDAAHEACERARRGEGPTLIEAKMMRMKGHAIHDAADYVPKPLFEYWRKRDPIGRFEKYLLSKKWLSPQENENLIADVERELEAEREFAMASPMPEPESAAGGVYCDSSCHEIRPKYGVPKTRTNVSSRPKETTAAVHFK